MGKSIEVILLEDVKDLGRSGETCRVRAGYARNFLFPSKQATVLTPATRRLVERKRAEAAERLAREKEEATALLAKLEALTLKMAMRANTDGRLFGAVSSAELAARLVADGFAVERRAIIVEEPIKTVGDFEIALHLHPEVHGTLKLKVVAEKEKSEAADA